MHPDNIFDNYQTPKINSQVKETVSIQPNPAEIKEVLLGPDNEGDFTKK